MNITVQMGRLTADPEARTASTGTSIASFNLAVDRRFKKEGQPDADFFRYTAFGKLADFVMNYLHKGTKIVVEGEVQNNNYEKDGQKVYGFNFIAHNIDFAESKKASQANATASAPADTSHSDDFMKIPEGEDDALPFT